MWPAKPKIIYCLALYWNSLLTPALWQDRNSFLLWSVYGVSRSPQPQNLTYAIPSKQASLICPHPENIFSFPILLSSLVSFDLLSLSCPAFSNLSLMATKISLLSLWTEVQMAIQRLWGTTWELGEVRRRPWLVEIANQGLKGKGRAQRTVSVGVKKSGEYGSLQGRLNWKALVPNLITRLIVDTFLGVVIVT